MSNSRSTTPTPNPVPTTPTITAPSLEQPDTSRPETHETTPTSRGHVPSTQSAPSAASPATPGPSTARRLLPSAESSSTRRRSFEGTSEDRPSKRMRQGNSPAEPASHSSPGSSQGGMADNETEGEPSQASSSKDPAPPQKKKRTRTLTTPHQSAVLHALLAQSRFPTTAMREEVGRSIGLSARKVQIWFQNQRQKARRPRSQSDVPLTDAPPFGRFASSPSSGRLEPGRTAPATVDPYLAYQGSYPSSSSSGHGEQFAYGAYGFGRGRPEPPREYYSPSHPPSSFPRQVESAALLGPGVPGSAPAAQGGFMHGGREYSRRTSPGGRYAPISPANRSAPPYPMQRLRGSESPPAVSPTYQLPPLRPSTGGRAEGDFSRTLPPLVFETSPRRGGFSSRPGSSHPSSSHSPSSAISSEYGRVPSSFSESPFAYQHPERGAPPASSSSLALPPPMPMQPQPQWDVRGYASRARSSWSGPPSSYRPPSESSSAALYVERMPSDSGRLVRRHSDIEGRSVEEQGSFLPGMEATPQRSRRFDPVRAAAAEEAPAPSRLRRGSDEDGDSNE